MNLSTHLLEAREKKGLTQKELASKLGIVSAQLISNWERGLCTPPIKKISKLSKILSIDFDPTFALVMKWKETQAKVKALGPKKTVKLSKSSN